MTATGNITQRLGATPGKIALVGVLGVVFVVVLFVQFGGDEATDTTAEKPRRRGVAQRAPESAESTSGASKASQESPAKAWPQIPLEEIIRHDPFAPPASLIDEDDDPETPTPLAEQPTQPPTQPFADDRAERLARLRVLSAEAVLMGEEGNRAIVGSRLVRVGDTLEGFTITAIGPDGVTLALDGDEVVIEQGGSEP